MGELEVQRTPRKCPAADGLMHLRRQAMAGCLGLLFLTAASGVCPRQLIDLAYRALGGSQGHTKMLAPTHSAGLFQPFGGELRSEVSLELTSQGQTSRGRPTTELCGDAPLWGSICPSDGAIGTCSIRNSTRRGTGYQKGAPALRCSRDGTLNDTTAEGCDITPRHGRDLSIASGAPYILGRLQELGAKQYGLEAWGPNGEVYRFWCRIPVGESPRVARYFQAIDCSSEEAVARVVAQIEAWRRGG